MTNHLLDRFRAQRGATSLTLVAGLVAAGMGVLVLLHVGTPSTETGVGLVAAGVGLIL